MLVKELVREYEVPHSPDVIDRLKTRYRNVDPINLFAYARHDLDNLNPRMRPGQHTLRVRLLSAAIGDRLFAGQIDRAAIIDLSAGLHDIAKTGRPDLFGHNHLWQNGQETEAQKHAADGALVLEAILPVPIATPTARTVLYHHFPKHPQNLPDSDYPIEARVVHLADAFDAMTSRDIPTRRLSIEQALRMVQSHLEEFDPEVTAALLLMSIDQIKSLLNLRRIETSPQFISLSARTEHYLQSLNNRSAV